MSTRLKFVTNRSEKELRRKLGQLDELATRVLGTGIGL